MLKAGKGGGRDVSNWVSGTVDVALHTLKIYSGDRFKGTHVLRTRALSNVIIYCNLCLKLVRTKTKLKQLYSKETQQLSGLKNKEGYFCFMWKPQYEWRRSAGQFYFTWSSGTCISFRWFAILGAVALKLFGFRTPLPL